MPDVPEESVGGSTGSVAWCGMLSNMHGILDEVLPVYLRAQGNASKPVTLQDFQLPEGDGDIRLGLEDSDMAVRGIPRDQQLALVAVDGGNAGGQEEAPLGEGGASSWAEHNRRARTSAADMARLKPGPELALASVCSAPLAKHIMPTLLAIAGGKWDKDVYAGLVAGRPRKYRLLESARGLFQPFFEATRTLLAEPASWDSLAGRSRSTAHATLGFKLLSRAAGSVEALLTRTHQAYPFRLFLILDGDPEVGGIRL